MDKHLCRLFFLFLSFLIGVSTSQAEVNSITVVSSSVTEFRFNVNNTPDLTGLVGPTDTDSIQSRYKSVLIGVPYGASAEVISSVGRSPVAISRTNFQNVGTAAVSKPLVTLSRPIVVRGRQLVLARIFPVIGDAIYTEVEVGVSFRGGLIEPVSASPDPYFDRIFKATVVNFDQMKGWPVPPRRSTGIAQPEPFSLVSNWYKISVGQTGLHKVTGSQLRAAGLILDNISPAEIHVFNGGGLQLDILNETQRPEFKEISILIEDGGDGVFDSDDYIIFFGEAVNRWVHRAGESPSYRRNHFTDHNVYWLAVSDELDPVQRMVHLDASSIGGEDTVITGFHRLVHCERDTLLGIEKSGRLRNYYNWYWFEQSTPMFYVSTPDAIDGAPAEIEIVAKNMGVERFVTLSVENISWELSQSDDSSRIFSSTDTLNRFSRVQVDFGEVGSIPVYLDYANMIYESRLIPINGRLDITLGSYEGSAQLEIVDTFDTTPVVLDLTDPLRPAIITEDGYEQSNGFIALSVQLEATGPNRFYVATLENAFSPLSVEKTDVTDLRHLPDQADYIIVTADRFIDALDEYIDYRTSGGYSVKVVTVEDVYDNFSRGLVDPVAIRDFLKFTYENFESPAPAVVLFVGDGNYDFLHHLKTNAPNYVPPFVHSHPSDSSYSDDLYVYFGAFGWLDSDSSYYNVPDKGLDMIPARWPISSSNEIAVIVEKTRRYESSTDFSLWRTKVALVADDFFVKTDGKNTEHMHTTQTEELAREHLPLMFSRDKIYAMEHPFVNLRKPTVNDAIVEAINDGRLLVNFVGHGNPSGWAHERIFTISDDMPRLNNYDRLPVVFAASCAIGFYDDPTIEAMAEEFLVHPSGGAIAVVSATRLVWSNRNELFNQEVFNVLFDDNDLSVCEAVFTAKLRLQMSGTGGWAQMSNDRAYIYMGDPFFRLSQPQLEISFSSQPDSLVALEPTTITGEIYSNFGNRLQSDGLLEIQIYDSDRRKTYIPSDDGAQGQPIDYTVDGPTIYRGSGIVSAGTFSFDFIPPLDIGYGGKSARVAVYAVLDSIDAIGVIDSIAVTDSIAPFADSIGPVVEYTFSDRENFISGDVIGADSRLEVTLTDSSSGINLTAGLGHGITLVMDDQSDKVMNLTSFFEYDLNDHFTGRLVCNPGNLQPGRHSFKIKAWDNANNSATEEFVAEVIADEGSLIADLMNYPNPTDGNTRFSCYVLRVVESFFLEIFTLSGRKIMSFGPILLEPGFFDDIVWEGTDYTGDRVATGVYIYKATARSANDQEATEVYGKVVVVN
ncbi:MAG: type IX secretion system sortase PorU [candidate division Zixibacteria bacterium]|nr:type IX secretion system sortase PorU [candidate division Zixibacteria bacterium]